MSILISDEKSEKTWGEIFFDFFDYAKERFEIEMRRRRIEAIEKIVASVLFLLGFIYFLNGLVEVFAKLFNGNGWLGNMIVGIILGIVGLVLIKK